MITCWLDVIDVAENFVSFQAKSIIHLVTQLDEISQKMQTLASERLPEIDVYIELNGINSISSADSNALCNFVSAKTNILFRLHLQHDAALTSDIVALLQKRLDIAFWRATSAWHQKKSSLIFDVPLKNLLSVIYPFGLPAPSLMIQQSQSRPIEAPPSEKQNLPMMQNPRPPLAVSETRVSECKKIVLDGQSSLQKYQHRVLSLLPQELTATILACVGTIGLSHLCEQLYIFDREDLQDLIAIFFNEARAKDMLDLLTPRGISYLKLCGAWPKNLTKHWLHWLTNNIGPAVSFFDAVALMDYFWQEIKHLHPEIGIEKNQGPYSFVKRISEMLVFLDSIPEESKKIQLSFLFSLDWQEGANSSTQLQRYLEILQRGRLIFICKPMLQQPMKIRAAQLPLDEANESSCLQYIAQHLQDKSHNAIQTIKYYMQDASDALAYQLAAWCACVSTTISKPVYQEIYRLLSLLSQEQQSLVLEEMFAQEINRRLSTDDLNILFSIAHGNKTNFVALIKIYGIWLNSQQESFYQSWKILTHYLLQDPRPTTLTALFECSVSWAQQNLSAKNCYFQALICCLAKDEDRQNNLFLKQIYTRFFQLSESKQNEIASVISSYDFSKRQPLNLNKLLILLGQNIEDTSLEVLFNQHFPDGCFLYYKSVIDYQLVFNSIEDLISSVQESINFFLSDEKIFKLFKIKQLLLREVHTKLKAQQHLLDQFLKDLQHLKTQKNEIDLTLLFNHLKEFEVFFLDFINWKLGRIFGENSWLLSGFAFSGPLIHQLDPSLSADSSLRDLMYKILDHHQLVSQSPIGYHFQFEILKIMITPSDIPVLQRYLDNRLVKGIIEKLNTDILTDLSDSIIAKEKLIQLSKFLHQLPLEQAGLNAFFQRYLGIKQVLKTWKPLEARLTNIELDPEAVWEILLRHQIHNGQAYGVAHWQVGMSLLNHLIDWHTRKLIPSHFPILPFVEGFYGAKNSLKAIQLHATGELKHAHWQKLLDELQKAIVSYGNHPMFLNILPKSIEHILSQGEAFNFKQGLEVFAGFSQNPQLIPRLYQLMNHDDREVQHRVGNLLLVIGDMLARKDRRPWQKFMIRLLSFADFFQHIVEIEDLLAWINQESQFYCWIELVAYDEKASLSEILALKNIIKSTNSPWVKHYENVYKSKPKVAVEPLQSQPSEGKLSRFFSKLRSFLGYDKAPVLQELVVRPNPDNEIMTQAWLLWSKAPYPDTKRLLSWLQANPQDIVQELKDFDRFPLGQLTAYDYKKKDLDRWMAEIEFYESSPPSKIKLAERLTVILTMINEFLILPRTELISQFHTLKQQINDKNIQQQNQLIALLATIYYKSTNRKPYPTQLLTILLTFEYQARHLIFEVDTGEGKGITTALLAVLKWALRDKATIEVRTANRDLVKQDFYEKGHWQFFKLLNIEHAVIEQDSALESYREGGIYYTTQDDMMVFQENRRLAGFVDQFQVDILADEVDSLLLDQKSLINLAYQNPQLSDHAWIYFAINQFVDQKNHCLTNSLSLSIPQGSEVIKANQLIEKYSSLLREVLIGQNKHKIYRLIQIEKITASQWQDWLVTALYAKTLLENKDFLVEEIQLDGQKMHKVVPYINGEVKYGFELSFQMKSGLTQFLHARLDSPTRQFVMQPESKVISQLPALDFRNINSFVGYSGSIGCLSELFDMLESNSRAVRIPRFYPSSLKVLPNILVDNSHSLNQALVEMVGSTINPMLIVTEKIEDAHHLYKSLMILFPKRPIKLITGQESEIERRDWLHANDGYHYAGSAQSITVSTLICGRGTDIVVKKPHHLEVKQIGILGPRNGVQIKGRTARVSALGSYQVIYSREILQRDWGFLNSHLPPLDVSTLMLWIEKIQEQLIYQNRQNRLHLRLKGWCQKHLFDNLAICLQHTDLNESEKQTYHLFIAKELEELTNQISQKTLNLEDYIKGCSLIWKKVLIKFNMAGYEHPYCTEAIFFNSLVADSDGALRLVSQTLALENEASPLVKQQAILSDEFLIALKNSLLKFAPKESLNLNKQSIPWYSLIRRVKSWFFDNSDLVNHSYQCLQKSWDLFNQKPSFENWQDFHQNLLAAVKLYSRQEKQSIWHLSYWFPRLNPLSTWLAMHEEVRLHLSKNIIPPTREKKVYEVIKASLEKKFPKKNKVSQLWQDLLDWWWKLMSFFNRDIENTFKLLNKSFKQFTDAPNQENLKNLHKQLNQAKVIFLEAEKWRSFRIGYWIYWQKRTKVWLDLADELDNIFTTCSEKAMSLHDWQDHQEQVANLQVGYRTELLNKAENMASLSQYSFWRSKNQSVAVHQIQDNYEHSLTGAQLIQHQILELAKLYPTQIQELYQIVHPHPAISEEQLPKHAYAMILSIIYAYANPSQSQSTKLHLSAKPMTVLTAELQRLSKRREILGEWGAHQTTIDMGMTK